MSYHVEQQTFRKSGADTEHNSVLANDEHTSLFWKTIKFYLQLIVVVVLPVVASHRRMQAIRKCTHE